MSASMHVQSPSGLQTVASHTNVHLDGRQPSDETEAEAAALGP